MQIIFPSDTGVVIADCDREIFVLDKNVLPFDAVERKLDRYATELMIERPRVARGTNAAYNMMEVLAEALVTRAEATGDTVMSDLTPQLVGLEDHKVRVTDTYEDTRVFTVQRSATNPPFHVELRPNGDRIPAHEEYQKVEVIA